MNSTLAVLGIVLIVVLASALSAAICAAWIGFWVWVTPFTWSEVTLFSIFMCVFGNTANSSRR